MKLTDKKGVLIGLPDDTGVYKVGGRPGAALGPAYFRQAWERLKGPAQIKDLLPDAGDAECGDDSFENHLAAEALIQKHSGAEFSIIIGGGHDLLLPHLRALGTKGIGCINIDPHFDMRPDKPEMTSGSGLFAALEQRLLLPQNLCSFGIQPYANSDELASYAFSKGVKVLTFDELRDNDKTKLFRQVLEDVAAGTEAIVLSLDMDALQAAFAPGVSAPAAEGFTPSEVISFIRIAAAHPNVISFGIYELNPSLDIDNRTAVLAAVLAWHFVAGRRY